MGRPRKITDGEETQEDGENMPERVEPKDCPNCGAVAVVGKDNQGMHRCNCSACGYWDSVAYRTESEAVEGWNQAGGIPKADY